MNIWILLLSLSFTTFITVQPYIMLSTKLTCFSEPTGDKTKDCDKTRGFRTCFTRYDHDDKVTGRGCSTKKSSYKACETHSYGEVTEKFCYCTAHLCNPSSLPRPSSITLALPLLLLLLLHLTSSVVVPASHLVTDHRTIVTRSNTIAKHAKRDSGGGGDPVARTTTLLPRVTLPPTSSSV